MPVALLTSFLGRYLGFDVGDPIYDISGAWEELETDFRRLATEVPEYLSV